MTVSSRFSAVTMQQEKSRALLSTPERPVRRSVLAILAQMASIRLLMIAICTPSSVPSALRVSVFLAIARLPGSRRYQETARGPALGLGPGVDHNGGEGRFDDRGPVHGLAWSHAVEVHDARLDQP